MRAAYPDLVGRGETHHTGHAAAHQDRLVPTRGIPVSATDAARRAAALGGAQAFLQLFQRVVGLQLGRLLRQLGLLVHCRFVERLQQLGTFLQLGQRLVGSQLRFARLGAEQQALPGTQGPEGLRRQLRAEAALGFAHVVFATLQVAQGQRGGVLGSGKLRAALAGRVIQAHLLIAALPALAVGQGLALEAGVDRSVLIAIEPRRRIARGVGAAAGDLVMGGIGLTAAVVDRTDHDRPVDVTLEEGHQHFLAATGQHHAAPVVAGPGGHHPHPGPCTAVGRGVVVTAGMDQTGAGTATALPRELHLDAMVAIGLQRLAVADHDGAERAGDRRARMQTRAVTVFGLRAIHHVGRNGDEAVVIEGRSEVRRCIRNGQATQGTRQAERRLRGRPKLLLQRVEHIGFEIVARLVLYRQAQEGGAGIHARMLPQLELRPGRELAPFALPFNRMRAHAQRIQVLLRATLATRVVLPAVRAAGVGVLTLCHLRFGTGLPQLQRAVVPGVPGHLGGTPAARGRPLLDAVIALGHIAPVEAHRTQVLGTVMVVGQHQGVGTVRLAAWVASMLEPVIDALFGQQALHEGQVGFLVLRGQAALGVEAAVGEVPAPGRYQPAVVGEHVLDDVDHAGVMKYVTVHALAQEGQPRLQAQAIPRQAAVAADPLGRGDPAVERAWAADGLHLQYGGLAQQAVQRQVGIGRQCDDVEHETHAIDLLDASERLGHQHVAPQRGAQLQQALGLPRCRKRGQYLGYGIHLASIQ